MYRHRLGARIHNTIACVLHASCSENQLAWVAQLAISTVIIHLIVRRPSTWLCTPRRQRRKS
jgi:hypothetical protein